jgi:hypothetical protein
VAVTERRNTEVWKFGEMARVFRKILKHFNLTMIL